MNLRTNGLICLLVVFICLSVAPNVHAQTTTITDLQYPKQVSLQNGVAQATVTFTVGFSGLPSGDVLAFTVLDAGTSTPFKGSGTSTPDSCHSVAGTSAAGYAVCLTAPSSSSGTESASFSLTFSSAQEYALRAGANIMDSSTGVVSGSLTTSDFTISVTSPPAQTTITDLQYPKQVVFQNGVAQATVTFTVGFSGLPSGYYLAFGVYYADTSDWVAGSGTSMPDSCISLAGTKSAGSVLCETIPTSSSGTESGSFVLTFNSIREYSLVGMAGMADKSGNWISGSKSRQTFTISVTPPPAQTTTTTNLQYPKQVALQNGVAQATVTFTAGFSGLLSGYYLAFLIVYADTSNYVTGSGTSTPDSCQSLAGTEYANSALCPSTPTSSSGTESVSFVLTFNSTGEYSLAAGAIMLDKSGNTISSSASGQAFTISVTLPPQVQVTLNAQPADVTVTLDGVAYTGNQFPKVFTWDPGSTHTLQVNPTIETVKGARYVFVQWNDGSKDTTRTITASETASYTATFKTQYQLTVSSDLGNPQGGGWYDANTQATFSVTTPLTLEGFMGTLGGKYVLDHWSGDVTAATATASVTMDGPKTVKAEWRTDNTTPYIIIGAIVAAIAIIAALILMRRRRVPTPASTYQPPSPAPAVPQAPPPVTPLPPQAPPGVQAPAAKFCVNCGAQISAASKFCPRCAARQG